MDPFLRRLVERMLDPRAPLSRNKHFHALDNPEGRAAQRIVRRLKSLRQDVAACLASGAPVTVRQAPAEATVVVQLERPRARRATRLTPAEYGLLRRLEGMEALPGLDAAG